MVELQSLPTCPAQETPGILEPNASQPIDGLGTAWYIRLSLALQSKSRKQIPAHAVNAFGATLKTQRLSPLQRDNSVAQEDATLQLYSLPRALSATSIAHSICRPLSAVGVSPQQFGRASDKVSSRRVGAGRANLVYRSNSSAASPGQCRRIMGRYTLYSGRQAVVVSLSTLL